MGKTSVTSVDTNHRSAAQEGNSEKHWCALLLFSACFAFRQHVSVFRGQVCSDIPTCCQADTEAADHTSYLTQSRSTDTGPSSVAPDPATPGAFQCTQCSTSHWLLALEVSAANMEKQAEI